MTPIMSLLFGPSFIYPSYGYTKHLLPHLFSNMGQSKLQCETYLGQKSSCIFSRSSLVTTISATQWFVTFIDDCTKITWLYSLKHKTNVFYVFCAFHAIVITQLPTNI
ncbi:hypothetical protein CR513_01201, partial [Mucuna pruriens]